MNTLELLPYVYGKFIIFILVLSRVSALFATFIVFKREYINARILVSLSSIISFYVVTLSPNIKITYEIFSIQMLMVSLFQVFIGFLTGFVLNMIFEIVLGFGQIVSTQIGLGMASVFDPKLGSITPLSQFYVYAITLIFLMLNGHLFLIKTIIDSFSIVGLNEAFIPKDSMMVVLNYSASIFSGAILLSLTIIVAIMLVNFSLAIMTRFAPQFNIFSVGISLALILGLICIYVTFSLFVDSAITLVHNGFNLLQTVEGKLK